MCLRNGARFVAMTSPDDSVMLAPKLTTAPSAFSTARRQGPREGERGMMSYVLVLGPHKARLLDMASWGTT
jgi:hypothetical protein